MKSILRSAVLLAAFSLPVAAHAVPVTLSGLQNQTSNGQNFTFAFNGLAQSDGGTATFVLRARGDYMGGRDETLTWSMDSGIVTGGPVGGFDGPGAGCGTGIGGPFDYCTVFVSNRDVLWQRTYTISSLSLTSLLANGSLNIFVNLADNVDALELPRYVAVDFTYNTRATPVPEPASLALLGLGLVGLGLARRKRPN